MRPRTATSTVRQAHTGSVLVVALICLLLLTVLAASLTRTVILQREQVIRDEWQLQAEWLAESAVDRAVLQLQSTPDYEGEEWQPRLVEAGVPLGQVNIIIVREQSETESSLTRIDVTADVPSNTSQRARVQRTTTFQMPDGIED